MTSRIFVSYRRSDSSAWAGRIYDRLLQVFSQDDVFMDVLATEPGADFLRTLTDHLSTCRVMIVIIGRHWLDGTDSEGRRLIERPDDYVRMELVSALERGIRIIPVLVDGARMPLPEYLPNGLQNFAYRQAIEITHARFRDESQSLIETLARSALSEGTPSAAIHNRTDMRLHEADYDQLSTGLRSIARQATSISIVVFFVGCAISVFSIGSTNISRAILATALRWNTRGPVSCGEWWEYIGIGGTWSSMGSLLALGAVIGLYFAHRTRAPVSSLVVCVALSLPLLILLYGSLGGTDPYSPGLGFVPDCRTDGLPLLPPLLRQ